MHVETSSGSSKEIFPQYSHLLNTWPAKAAWNRYMHPCNSSCKQTCGPDLQLVVVISSFTCLKQSPLYPNTTLLLLFPWSVPVFYSPPCGPLLHLCLPHLLTGHTASHTRDQTIYSSQLFPAIGTLLALLTCLCHTANNCKLTEI